MSSRRWLLGVAAFSAALHVLGMVRTPLPAQDGLKFLRVARQFQTEPWVDAVRSSDQHPLYPALVALAEPIISAVIGHGPDAWRLAAQGVSALAALALLWPLHGLTRHLFDERAANLAVLFYALLPFPAAIGHDTLSDSLALGLTVGALGLGEMTLRTRSWRAALGCGALAGLGYLTRPEVALVPPVVVLAAMIRRRPGREELAMAARLAVLTGIAGLFVGSYALVKGELSEKLSLRRSSALDASSPTRKLAPQFPKGLNSPKFDFSPKEESDEPNLIGKPLAAADRLAREWAEGITYLFIPLMLWGLIRKPALGSADSVDGRRLVLIYLVVFAAVAIRHGSALGYLSGRHALSLIVATVPWAAAGAAAWTEGFAFRRGMSPAWGRRLGYAALAVLAVAGTVSQARSGHPSRWGYRAAGIWLAREAAPGEAVLDTRGWASFVRGIPGYDYWHVRQALSDSRLRYVVVGTDELEAKSRRAATLRAMLAYAGRPVAEFPGREDGRGKGVKVFRFDPPASWEKIHP